MQKERILRLHDIIFELYADEENKANISKKLKISPQTIGPDLDLLEEVKIIRKSRIEQRKGIPSTYYITDIQSILKSLKVPQFDIAFQFLFKLKSCYVKIKKLELKGEKLPIYSKVFPLGSEIFLLQFLGSLLLFAAIMFFPHIKFYKKLKDELPIDFERINSVIKTKGPKIPEEIINWIKENNEEINEIYEFVWNNLYKKFFVAMFQEHTLGIITEYKESQEEMIQKQIQQLRAHNLLYGKISLKNIDDLINYERKTRQNLFKNINNSVIQVQKAMKKTLDDKETLGQLDSIRAELAELRTDSRKSIINREDNLETAQVKLEIIIVLLVESNLLLNLCSKINNTIDLQNWEIVPVLIREISSHALKLNNLIVWQQNMIIDSANIKNVAAQLKKDFKIILGEYYEPLKKPKYKKKEYYKKLSDILLSLGESIQKNSGGIILLSNLYLLIKDKYPQIEFEVDDLKTVLNKLKKKKLILGLKKQKSGIEIVRFYPSEVSNDISLVLELATELGPLKISDLMTKLNWTHERSQVVLEDLEKKNIAKKSKKYSEGEIWFFPGLKRRQKIG